MSSYKQRVANRRNAAKSTGPKTKQGKQRARKNALKHGLRAGDLLTPDENPADYERFRDGALEDLRPVGFLERNLADTIVNTLWRARRCERIEAGLLGGGKHVMDEIAATSIEKLAMMLEPDIRPEDCTHSQLPYHEMVMRIRAEFVEWRRCGDRDPAQFCDRDESEIRPAKDSILSHLPNEDLVDEYLRTREDERQKNPLSYSIALAFKRDISGDDALTKLPRNEAALDRKLYSALSEFKRLQAARIAEAAATAEVIDVSDLNED